MVAPVRCFHFALKNIFHAVLRGIHIDSRATIYLKLRLHSEPAVSVVSRPVTKRIKGVVRPTNAGVNRTSLCNEKHLAKLKKILHVQHLFIL